MTRTSTGRFEGAIVLVTGGGSGIGAAAVRQFDREGCTAVHVADVDIEGAQAVAADTRSGRAEPVDVTAASDVDALVDRIVAEHGRLDVVVNTAGVDDPQAKQRIIPDELADNILYLASPGASNVVGAVLLSNGGRFTV